MTDLLLRFKETVRVVLSKDGSDTRILPAGAESPGEDGAPAVSASSSPVTELINKRTSVCTGSTATRRVGGPCSVGSTD